VAILIVEPEFSYYHHLEKYLVQHGYEVLKAVDTEEAEHQLAVGRVDLVMVEYWQTGWFEITRFAQDSGIPTIVVTSSQLDSSCHLPAIERMKRNDLDLFVLPIRMNNASVQEKFDATIRRLTATRAD
jgi:DNA-binding NtrC family response regulator